MTMGMAKQLRKLRAMDDDALVFAHDVQAEHTVVGIDYYLRELARRDAVRAAEASDRLARASLRLAWISTATSVLGFAAAVVALLLR